MQTKQQIEQLLNSASVRPDHRLGQHFLIDLNLMRFLVNTAGIDRSDVILEVGCGTGSLTAALAERAGSVIAVEYDSTLMEIAEEQLSGFGNITLITGDVLESKSRFCQPVVQAVSEAMRAGQTGLMLLANLPYSVAGAVMANLITGPVVADAMYVTVQKELARRCVAAPSGRDYGILSILMAATGKAKILKKLKPTVFWPQPAVDSAFVEFRRDSKRVSQIRSMELFRDVLSLFMGHRRKMLSSCVRFAAGPLASIHNWHEIFAEAFVEPHLRGENITAADYISIANLCYRQL